jgi:hypothetical protein
MQAVSDEQAISHNTNHLAKMAYNAKSGISRHSGTVIAESTI